MSAMQKPVPCLRMMIILTLWGLIAPVWAQSFDLPVTCDGHQDWLKPECIPQQVRIEERIKARKALGDSGRRVGRLFGGVRSGPESPLKASKDRKALTTRVSNTGLPAGKTSAAAAMGAPSVAAGSVLGSTATMAAPWSTPDYYAIPNWLNSPLPEVCDGSDTTVFGGACTPATPIGSIAGGMRKFVDTLPGFCGVSTWASGGAGVGKNNLNQCIPVATPDTGTFPGSDYYELELLGNSRQMHSDLPPTRYLGYRQVGANADATQYLGPAIIATRNRPVRVKFFNKLTEDIPLPYDTSMMGAGNIQVGPTPNNFNQAMASRRRANLHLHGGLSPWISDGTPHQWVTPPNDPGVPPALRNTLGFGKGMSFQHVPDMAPGGDPLTAPLNDGIATYYWTNQQSGRLMFYHDHASGSTRLSVYAGEAAPYLLVDPVVETALAAAGAPGTVTGTPDFAHIIPLVLQDKTFVPDNGEPGGQLAAYDPTWDVAKWGKGSFWLPHVYMPNQVPGEVINQTQSAVTVNGIGRWDYGPWTPLGVITNIGPVPCTTAAAELAGVSGLTCPGTPNPFATPESGFHDTPLINGTAYPTVRLDADAYRLHILNAANDRFFNIGLFYAVTQAPKVIILDPDPGATGAVAEAKVGPGGQITSIEVIDPGTGYTAPQVFVRQPGTPENAVVTANVVGGEIASFTINNPGSGYVAGGTVCKDIAAGPDQAKILALCTEVAAEPAVPHRGSVAGATAMPPVCPKSKALPVAGQGQVTALLDGSGNLLTPTGLAENCWPETWPAEGNARSGPVPNPLQAGPPLIQIGNEVGLLPKPVVIPGHPLGMNYDRKMAIILTVDKHGLYLGPAERADVLVDFHAFKPSDPNNRSVFILYNDGSAPGPLYDVRFDYYSGDPDFTDAGGAPSTLEGYGPNIRTMMRIEVSGNSSNQPVNLASLTSAMPSLFNTAQHRLPIREPWLPDGVLDINNLPANGSTTILTSMQTTLKNPAGSPLASLTLTNPGAGYTSPPPVTIAPPTGAFNPVQATAVANLSPTAGVNLGTYPTTNQGSGYSSPPTVGFTGGGGGGAAAFATLNPTSLAANGITVTNGGSGYALLPAPAPTVTISGGGGSGAVATANLTGRVDSLLANVAGSLYTAAPTVTIAAPQTPGTTATATAVLSASGPLAKITGSQNTSCSQSGPYTVVIGAPPAGGTQATATVTLSPTNARRIASVNLTNPGSGYTTAPTVTINRCNQYNATAFVGRGVVGYNVVNRGSGYTAPPAVTIARAAGDTTGSGASATANVSGSVASITVNNVGSGFSSTPTVTIDPPPGPGVQATATATLATTGVASITVTAAGSGYATAPNVTFSGGGGTNAAAAVTLAPRAIASLVLTNPGSGYVDPPAITIPGGATAKATLVPIAMAFKGVVEGFDPIYGTMSANLGASLPVANNPQAVGAIPLSYVDPPSEMMGHQEIQVWKLEHLGVDSHAIHFHLFEVQQLNTNDLAGQIYTPNPNDAGWKETIKTHPFQDTYVALRPIKPVVPWELPDSYRPLNPDLPLGVRNTPNPLPANTVCANNPFLVPQPNQVAVNCLPFSPVDPMANAVTTTNTLINFGWEYVLHCHLLGHEERDMMRPITFVMPPADPTAAPTLSNRTRNSIRINWVDWTKTENAFIVQSSTDNGATWTNLTTITRTAAQRIATGGAVQYTRSGAVSGERYRVLASKTIGCDATTCSVPAVVGGVTAWPLTTVNSQPSPASSAF